MTTNADKTAHDLAQALDTIAEHEATIARLHDLVAKFQRGETSTLHREGKV